MEPGALAQWGPVTEGSALGVFRYESALQLHSCTNLGKVTHFSFFVLQFLLLEDDTSFYLILMAGTG